MNLKNFTLGWALVLLLALSVVTAGQTTRSIYLPKGKNVTPVSGTVKGNQYLDYRVNVETGQTLKVTLNSKSKSVYFNVLPPGSVDVSIYNSSTGENRYSHVADQSGIYTIRVYLMGAAKSENRTANFSLNVGILKPFDTGDALEVLLWMEDHPVVLQ
jgi:hypothetical protein